MNIVMYFIVGTSNIGNKNASPAAQITISGLRLVSKYIAHSI